MKKCHKRPNIIRKVLSLKSIESLYFVVIVFLFLSVVSLMFDERPEAFSEKEIKPTLQITTQR